MVSLKKHFQASKLRIGKTQFQHRITILLLRRVDQPLVLVRLNGTSRIEFIFRNSEGKPTFYHSSRSSSSSVLQTEATALLHAVLTAKDHGIGRIVVESDNLALINAINGYWSTPWIIQDTIDDIKNPCHHFQYIKFSYC